jgi:hypothetical protein
MYFSPLVWREMCFCFLVWALKNAGATKKICVARTFQAMANACYFRAEKASLESYVQ